MATISRLGSQLTRLRVSCSRSIYTTYFRFVEQDWRYKNGLPRNPNSYGVLTDSRDFTFLDGRSTPLGTGQMKRLERNKAYAERIVEIVKEMDFAVQRHAQIQNEKEDKRKEILDSKFKHKGHLLLSKNK